MIVLVLGTAAELIKSCPVVLALAERGNRIEIWNTAMHVAHLDELMGLLTPDVPVRRLAKPGRRADIARPAQVPGWLAEIVRSTMRRRGELRSALRESGSPLLMVHGDTSTTVLGALIGRAFRVPVAHIEAGYRSGSLLEPFPEEMNRRLVAHIADIHFAPGVREAANLRRARGRVIDTGENTAIDALRMFAARDEPAVEIREPYGIVTLHRFELMRRPALLGSALEECREASRRLRVYFVTGPHGRARLAEHGLDRMFDDRFRLLERTPYPAFVPLLSGAEFVVTDSGGLQMECSYLGLPCLILRERTESAAGLGANVVVSGFEGDVMRAFLADPSPWRTPSRLDLAYPTRVIVDTLVELGLVD